jgi:hypothetical protein
VAILRPSSERYQDLIEHYLTGEINKIYGVLQTAETIDDIENGMPDTPCPQRAEYQIYHPRRRVSPGGECERLRQRLVCR